MGLMLPFWSGAIDQPPTKYSTPLAPAAFATQRLPTDALFFADITLQNIVVGSRYRVEYNDGADWQLLHSGEAVASPVTLTNTPAYANPMLVRIRVRKASGGTKYIPLTSFGFLVREGVSVYIAQQADEIAT